MIRRSTNKIKVAIKIVIVLILLFTFYIIGFATGVNNIPKAENGEYNISIHEGGVAVITTKLKHIETDVENKLLIVHGESTHDSIE